LGSGGFFDTTGEQHVTQIRQRRKGNITTAIIPKDRSKSRPNPKARFKKKKKGK
jgi:hypothetical protein